MPPPAYNPLAVTTDPSHPTELPTGDYEIAVFDNRFPSLSMAAHDAPASLVHTAPASGKCEVVVFTQDPNAALHGLSVARIDLLLQVWADRSQRALAGGHLQYLLAFENRGAEVGVTLHHPHGQIYCYPFVPPVPMRMLEQEAAYFRQHQRNMLCSMAESEIADGARVIYQNEHAVAFVPACARYPYEVWVMPVEHAPTFASLGPDQRRGLAMAVKAVVQKYEGLWKRPFPYLMAWFQAPLDGSAHPETQLHAEFYPPYRTPERLKYLAGTELAAGMFAMDVLPEQKAKELQMVDIHLDE